MATLYELIGADPSASQTDISRAYRKASKSCHPDACPGDATAAERFRAMRDAYDILSDPDLRRLYDETGTAFPLSEAESGLEALFCQAVEQTAPDPLAVCRDAIRETQRQITESVAKAKKRIVRLKERQSRLRCVGSRKNLLGASLETMILEAERAIASNEHALAVGEQMKVLLANYEYDAPEPTAQGPVFANYSTVMNVGGGTSLFGSL